jgi:hypothetical protein
VLGTHDNCAHFGVNLSIKACIADEVHNPSLSIIIFHVQFSRQHPNVNALVYAAVCLKDKKSGILKKLITQWNGQKPILLNLLPQKEVIHYHLHINQPSTMPLKQI